jgi:cytoplasmic tyrosine-protein kinase BMX
LSTEIPGLRNYSDVYKGTYGQRDVAIKYINMENKNRFFNEAKNMNELLHKNIVRLYGVCTQEEPIIIVTEFITHGCLLNFLRYGPGRSIKSIPIVDIAAQVDDEEFF